MLHRATRWAREQFAFLIVVVVLAAAFVYLLLEPGRWGRTSGVIAVAVLLAGVLRAVLNDERAGMLAYRGRVVDTISYLVLGAAILGIDIRLHG